MKLIQTYCLILLATCSCAKSVRQSDEFDLITIDEYENCYDSEGKIEIIKHVQVEQRYELKKLKSETINTSDIKYFYPNDSLYFCQKTGGKLSDEKKTDYYTSNAVESITISGDKDTVNYSLCRYADSLKNRIEYMRVIEKTPDNPILNLNNNYEDFYYYDQKGRRIKIIRNDFNKNQSFETYFYSDMSYEEALRITPKSINTQLIRCDMITNDNDTLVENMYVNGNPYGIKKIYTLGNKKIEHTHRSNGFESINISYKEGGLDITVNSFPSMDNGVDSVFRKKDKVMREVHISDDSKMETTYEYDTYGNLTKEIQKVKLMDLLK